MHMCCYTDPFLFYFISSIPEAAMFRCRHFYDYKSTNNLICDSLNVDEIVGSVLILYEQKLHIELRGKSAL
jgi:hypothetical protein